MKKIQLYWQMIRKTNGDKLLAGFFVFYLIDCFFLMLFDQSVTNYFDALWLGFSIATTIGLGDYTVTTLAARVCAVLLGVYGSIIEAYIPGLIASYYLQKMSRRRDQLLADHQEELALLDSMTVQQKKDLSAILRQEGME